MMKTVKKVPELRFPEFEGEWIEVKLEQITYRIGDGLHGTPEYVEDGTSFFINGNNLINGRININEQTKKVSQDSLDVHQKGLNKQTILISINGTIGSLARYNQENVMLGKSVGYFIFREESEFYFHHLSTDKIQRHFFNELTGTTIKNLSLKTLRETIVGFPSLPEQQKIASFLSAADQRIQLLTQKKEKLEQYKKGIMQQIFSQQLRFKDENGKDYPEWEEKRFDTYFKRITRKNSINNTNVLTISAQSGLVNQLDFFKNSVASKNLSNYYLLEYNDFAYNKSYSKGYPLGATKRLKYYDKGVVSVLYICFACKKNMHPDFAEQYFESGIHNKELYKIAQEGARNHGLLNMSIEDFFNTKILVPHIKEQQKIASFLSSLDQKISLVNQQIELTRKWKQGLLQKMFV